MPHSQCQFPRLQKRYIPRYNSEDLVVPTHAFLFYFYAVIERSNAVPRAYTVIILATAMRFHDNGEAKRGEVR